MLPCQLPAGRCTARAVRKGSSLPAWAFLTACGNRGFLKRKNYLRGVSVSIESQANSFQRDSARALLCKLQATSSPARLLTRAASVYERREAAHNSVNRWKSQIPLVRPTAASDSFPHCAQKVMVGQGLSMTRPSAATVRLAARDAHASIGGALWIRLQESTWYFKPKFGNLPIYVTI